MTTDKLLSIDELGQKVASAKAEGQMVVHCHGVFDLLHIGHIKHFEEAKSFGDLLVVTITADANVNKGPNRPAFTTDLRLQALAGLETVDYVAENRWPTAVEAIKLIKPHIYCKGPDFKNHSDDITGKIVEEEEVVKSLGGEIRYTSDITFSSSNLLNRFSDIYSNTQKSFIEQLRTEYSFEDIRRTIDDLIDVKVLVIGETIIDQYVFCEALGKSGKEPVLVLRDMETEQYAGGAAAIANHLADFSGKINLLSMLGQEGEYEDFIKSILPKTVSADFILKMGSPTIVKKRYVEHINKSKVLGVYSVNDELFNMENESQFRQLFEELISEYDLVIVSDYGHGMISKGMAKYMTEKSPFIALNAQINAANIGYHTMDKYKRVNCVIINETELRHELREKQGPLEPLIKGLSQKLESPYIVVTQGSDGATLYNRQLDEFFLCPAFASKVVDKIGAGDAMLALISILLFKDTTPDLSLFIGSLAAAQSVETIGNSIPVAKIPLLKSIQHAFK
ncbi:MAG: transposase [Candidatus Marinimicrobia bacterium]|nr:transposase [Candidatus Neomarinimicrobiota bacterium]|tara:strand:- start:34658 stop:36184 length:1527 start_codon:yes stop_codon:yes gene_type:complete